MKRWTRRSLMVGGSLLALPIAGLAAGKLWCLANSLPRRNAASMSPLAKMYPSSAASKALGKRYLEQLGSTVSASLQRLEARDQIMRAAMTGCPIEMATAVEQACCDDFRAGRFHCIDGWILSQTELDVATLSTT
jgi:hypothetical protein